MMVAVVAGGLMLHVICVARAQGMSKIVIDTAFINLAVVLMR